MLDAIVVNDFGREIVSGIVSESMDGGTAGAMDLDYTIHGGPRPELSEIKENGIEVLMS